MSFTSYSKSYYWGNICRRNKIDVNKTKTDRFRVLPILIYTCRSLNSWLT